MQKAVAVPYVIALILGIAVIALIGIWFVMSGGKFSTQSGKTLCDNKFLQWCSVGRSQTDTYATFKSGTECANIEGTYQRCNQALGTCKVKGITCSTGGGDECCSGTCTNSKCT